MSGCGFAFADESVSVGLHSPHAFSLVLQSMANPNLSSDKEALTSVDKEFENNIRPSSIEDFSGQPQIIENLKIFIKAAKMRGEALDHVLFHGPPGLGKTTLSRIVANELGVNIKETNTHRNKLFTCANFFIVLKLCKRSIQVQVYAPFVIWFIIIG